MARCPETRSQAPAKGPSMVAAVRSRRPWTLCNGAKTIMNRFALVASAVVLVSSGCSDYGKVVDPAILMITGEWSWFRTTGGFFPRDVTPLPGFVTKDTYRPDGTFFRHRNDTLFVRGQYSLAHENSNLVLFFHDVTVYWGYDAWFFGQSYPVTIAVDTMIVGGGCCDVPSWWFVRTGS